MRAGQAQLLAITNKVLGSGNQMRRIEDGWIAVDIAVDEDCVAEQKAIGGVKKAQQYAFAGASLYTMANAIA